MCIHRYVFLTDRLALSFQTSLDIYVYAYLYECVYIDMYS